MSGAEMTGRHRGHVDTVRRYILLQFEEDEAPALAALNEIAAEKQRLRDALEASASFIESILIGDEYGNQASPLNVAARRELISARAALDGTP
jgi:hypothetical protein